MTTEQLESIARAELVTLQHEPLVLAACVRAMQRAVAELERENATMASDLSCLNAKIEGIWPKHHPNYQHRIGDAIYMVKGIFVEKVK